MSFYEWSSLIKVFFAFFVGFSLYQEYRRDSSPTHKYLLIIVILLFAKELYYYVGDIFIAIPQRIPKKLALLIEKKFYLWNLIETAAIIAITYILSIWIDSKIKKKSNLIVLIVSIVYFAAYFVLSRIVKIPFFVGANWIPALLRIFLLVFLAFKVGRIYRLSMNYLPFIIENKVLFVSTMGIGIFFNLIIAFASGQTFMGGSVFVRYSYLLFFFLLTYYAYKIIFYNLYDLEDSAIAAAEQQEIVVRLLQDISNKIAENADLDTVLELIVGAACKSTSARSGAILLKERKDFLSVKTVHGLYPPVYPVDTSMMTKERSLVEKFKNTKVKIGETYLGQVAQMGEYIFIVDAKEDERIVQTAKGIMEIRNVIAVPMKIENEVIGVLSVLNKEGEETFSENDLNLLITLGDQAAVSINNVRLYNEMLAKKQAERELSVAGQIQMGLLPKEFPDFEKCELYAFSYPAKGVGGDYFDFIDFGNNKIAVVMADVAGKGVPAALVMVMIRSILRTYATPDKESKDIVSAINKTLSGEVSEEKYATMFYFVFDSEYKIINYTNAAHGPLLLYRNSLDSFLFLDTDGMPVGIVPECEYGQEYTSLHAGDIAVLYTDGITEAMNLQREQFGMERLQKVIRENKDLSAKEIADKVYAEITEFVGEAPQHDDQTLLLMKVK